MPAKTDSFKNVFTINKYSHNLLLNKHLSFSPLPLLWSCFYSLVLLSLNSSPTEINGSFKRSKVSKLFMEETFLYVSVEVLNPPTFQCRWCGQNWRVCLLLSCSESLWLAAGCWSHHLGSPREDPRLLPRGQNAFCTAVGLPGPAPLWSECNAVPQNVKAVGPAWISDVCSLPGGLQVLS